MVVLVRNHSFTMCGCLRICAAYVRRLLQLMLNFCDSDDNHVRNATNVDPDDSTRHHTHNHTSTWVTFTHKHYHYSITDAFMNNDHYILIEAFLIGISVFVLSESNNL